jgi:hypothetical protein
MAPKIWPLYFQGAEGPILEECDERSSKNNRSK